MSRKESQVENPIRGIKGVEIARFAVYIMFGKKEVDYPASANITYYESPASLKD